MLHKLSKAVWKKHAIVQPLNVDGLVQDSQRFCQRPNKQCGRTIPGPDNLRNVIVTGYVTFYQINKFFVKILFFNY